MATRPPPTSWRSRGPSSGVLQTAWPGFRRSTSSTRRLPSSHRSTRPGCPTTDGEPPDPPLLAPPLLPDDPLLLELPPPLELAPPLLLDDPPPLDDSPPLAPPPVDPPLLAVPPLWS